MIAHLLYIQSGGEVGAKKYTGLRLQLSGEGVKSRLWFFD